SAMPTDEPLDPRPPPTAPQVADRSPTGPARAPKNGGRRTRTALNDPDGPVHQPRNGKGHCSGVGLRLF
ncbi:MAG: hypothetical protein NZO58_06685, partial [Gemmataceae bacterium]|nr:hypothetical protein [Gemmataceae bacterium]